MHRRPLKSIFGSIFTRGSHAALVAACLLLSLTVVLIITIGVARHSENAASTESQRARPTLPSHVDFEVGQERSFDLHLDSQVKVAGQAAAAAKGSEVMDLAVDGILQLTVLRVDVDAATVHARIADARMSFSQGGSAGAAAGLAPTIDALRGGLAVTYGKDGVVRGFREEGELDRFASQLVRQAVSSLQMGLPAGGQSSAWNKEELDGTGTYRAMYRSSADGDVAFSFDKDKIGYMRIASEATLGGAPQMSGKARGHFTSRVAVADGWPITLRGEETIEVHLGAARSLTSTATSHVRCDFKGRRMASSDELALLTSRAKTKLATATSGEDIGRERARSRLGATTLAQVHDAYENLDKVDPRRRANAERALFDKTVDYIRVNDQALEPLLASLAGRKAQDQWLQNALGALAYVGCKKCQTALVEQVMARTGDRDFATTLVSLLAEPKTPSVEGEQALQKLEASSDPTTHSVAALGLGTVANKVAESDEGRADRIVGVYLGQFRSADSIDAKLAALAVLGNTGSPLLPAEIEALTHDPSEDVRAAAVSALRLCSPSVATPTLERMLLDPSARVRTAVVDAFAQQNPSTLAAELLSARLGVDGSAGVRGAIVRVLQEYYGTVPAAKAAVDLAAQSDPDPSVRMLAKNTRIMFAAR